MNKPLSLVLLALLSTGGAARAASHTEVPAASVPSTADATDGEIRKIDADAKKLTIRHGEIKHLGMPAMTMVFQVKDAAMLDKVKVGDKVRFTTEKISGAYTVTDIDVAK